MTEREFVFAFVKIVKLFVEKKETFSVLFLI